MKRQSFVNDGLRQYASHVIQEFKVGIPKESGSVNCNLCDMTRKSGTEFRKPMGWNI